ncbi:striatin-interacting protein 1-like [Amphibalanus amphitrite]|uniref:striatin-interacting protein 1-like n=1 Tax=Amphibalanus amphitrite TaxID=1232801 RepID=UPI001C907A06|nr:striatin-interacting protein 1-like [Amphibalanus amphitrite]XP_043223360.1 striatin-interacting protein 1-like [Amphibalanus amphitrite]
MDSNGNANGGKRGLDKLREIMLRNKEESECGDDFPELEFEYADTESHMNEIAELYSYTEVPEFQVNLRCFDELMSEHGFGRCWQSMRDERRRAVVLKLMDRLDLSKRDARMKAMRALLYVAQGCWAEVQSDQEQASWARTNVILLYRCGVFSAFLELLYLEIENGSTASAALRKLAVSLADSTELRVVLSLLYTMVEVMRVDDECDPDDVRQLREQFRSELMCPQDNGELVAVTLLGMVARFCSGAAPHFPMKKVLLLVWKVLLVTLGGSAELRRLKAEGRARAGLPPEPEDTAERTRHMRCSSPPLGSVDANDGQPRGQAMRLMRRGLMKQPSLDEDAEQELETGNGAGKAEGERADSPRPDSPRAETPAPPPNKGLPWTPKVRSRDVLAFLDTSRRKFVGYDLENDLTSTAGLPSPIKEGARVLERHVYKSLSEVQIEREEEIERSPFSRPEVDVEQTPVEMLYAGMLPNLPQYMIALLKVLLAAAPTSKTKTDSINILADALPEEMPMTVLKSMRLGIDLNRQKEIIGKAVSAVLLLLLKHLKVNHVYQFEFVSQHLVFANCIPLVLKFFNQDIMAYITSKNTIAVIDFPSCVIGDQSEVTGDTLEIGDQPFCWRNVFASINLLRMLNKLCKWKHSRIMMLVVFKSAPILKRALKVKQAMMQVYTLKLLKMQTKYLGRQWRKSNMKTISAIYQKVRHRLNDDWAFGNDVDARPWDFRAEECQLRMRVDRFNERRYGEPEWLSDPEYRPVDSELSSVLGRPVELTEEFRRDYRRWLHREVFQAQIDWDQLVEKGYL